MAQFARLDDPRNCAHNRPVGKTKRVDKRQRKQAAKRRQQTRQRPPRMGHESMLRIPEFRAAANALAQTLAVPPGAPPRLVTDDDLEHPAVDRMMEAHFDRIGELPGWSEEDVTDEIQLLLTHL